MARRKNTTVGAISAIALSVFVASVDAQRRVPGQAPPKQGIQVALKVGERAYQSSEPGKCTHAPTAMIYKTMSELWSVQQSSNEGSLALSFWKPKDGSGDMVTLSVSNGDASHDINTVRGGGTTRGTGTVRFEKVGNGGTFTVDAKTKEGASISGTIKCDAFAPHIAEGGL